MIIFLCSEKPTLKWQIYFQNRLHALVVSRWLYYVASFWLLLLRKFKSHSRREFFSGGIIMLRRDDRELVMRMLLLLLLHSTHFRNEIFMFDEIWPSQSDICEWYEPSRKFENCQKIWYNILIYTYIQCILETLCIAMANMQLNVLSDFLM